MEPKDPNLAIPIAVLQSPLLDNTAKICFGHIFRLMDGGGICTAQNTALARFAKLSVLQVKKAIIDLEIGGFIQVKTTREARRIRTYAPIHLDPSHLIIFNMTHDDTDSDDDWSANDLRGVSSLSIEE